MQGTFTANHLKIFYYRAEHQLLCSMKLSSVSLVACKYLLILPESITELQGLAFTFSIYIPWEFFQYSVVADMKMSPEEHFFECIKYWPLIIGDSAFEGWVPIDSLFTMSCLMYGWHGHLVRPYTKEAQLHDVDKLIQWTNEYRPIH